MTKNVLDLTVEEFLRDFDPMPRGMVLDSWVCYPDTDGKKRKNPFVLEQDNIFYVAALDEDDNIYVGYLQDINI